MLITYLTPFDHCASNNMCTNEVDSADLRNVWFRFSLNGIPDATVWYAWFHGLVFLMPRFGMPDSTFWYAWFHGLVYLMPRFGMPDATGWYAWCHGLVCLKHNWSDWALDDINWKIELCKIISEYKLGSVLAIV